MIVMSPNQGFLVVEFDEEILVEEFEGLKGVFGRF